MNTETLELQFTCTELQNDASKLRPPSWPPPPDWAPIVDAAGKPVCKFSDSTWPLDVWAGHPLKVNFGDGKIKSGSARIDPANAHLLRQCAAWFIFGPRGCRTAGSLADKVTFIKPFFIACSKQGILASDLIRFPTVIDEVAALLQPSKFGDVIKTLQDLLDAQDQLGFCLLNNEGLKRLTKLRPKHLPKQTPYIPPRIWTYQLNRFRQCLQDYIKHKDSIEKCFQFCVDAYAHNAGSLRNAMRSTTNASLSPFQNRKSTCSFSYLGNFNIAADHFGIRELLELWVGPFTKNKGEKQISKLSQYLDLVSWAGMGYLMNFSLMRIEEGISMRSDCLLIEHDDVYGDIHMLAGETTKTDSDSDARWPVSKSATIAIDAMKHISRMRVKCAVAHGELGVTDQEIINPFLISYQYEPWSKSKQKSYALRPLPKSYKDLVEQYPLFIEKSEITINAEDLRMARYITPTLNPDVFRIGAVWTFGWHQLRRTGAVNMLSSDLVDESSLQLQLKHIGRLMTLYYGRNHSRVTLSQETRSFFLKTMDEEAVRTIGTLTSPQLISPLGDARKESIISWIKDADARALIKAIKQGSISARPIRVGFCVNNRPCPYGGIESITHCLGGNDSKGCPDLLIDVGKETSINIYEKVVDNQLSEVHPGSPRHDSLMGEKRAISKFYAIVKAQNR